MLLEGKGACVGLEVVVPMEHFQAYLHHLHAACEYLMQKDDVTHKP